MESNKDNIENLEQIIKELKVTNRFLKKQVSYRKTFVRGVVNGLGAALGATIVLSILASFIIWGFSQLKFIPWVGGYAAEIVDLVQTNQSNPANSIKVR